VRSRPLGGSRKYVASDLGRALVASVGPLSARRRGQSPGIVYDDTDTTEDPEPEPTAPPPPKAVQLQAAEDEKWDVVSELHPAAELEAVVDPAAPVEQQLEVDTPAEGDAPAVAAQADVVDDDAVDKAAAEGVDEADTKAPEQRIEQETALQNLGYDSDVAAAETDDQRETGQAQLQAAPLVATAPPPPTAPPYYLCVTTTVKREARYMREWLAFHQLVGVEHFYIYDNESGNEEEPLLADVLASYQQQGTVSLHTWPGDRIIADCINLEQPLYVDRACHGNACMEWSVWLTFAIPCTRGAVEMADRTDNGPRRRHTTVARHGPTSTRSPRMGRTAAGWRSLTWTSFSFPPTQTKPFWTSYLFVRGLEHA